MKYSVFDSAYVTELGNRPQPGVKSFFCGFYSSWAFKGFIGVLYNEAYGSLLKSKEPFLLKQVL